MDSPPGTFLVPKFLVWYGLLQTTSRTTDLITTQLQERAGVDLPTLEALGLLNAADEQRLRMSALAEELLLSRGGVTRLVARLETSGYARRERPAEDQRAVYAVLTKAGRTALKKAYPVFDELLDSVFLAALNESDVRALKRAWVKVLHHVDASCHGLIDELERSSGGRTAG